MKVLVTLIIAQQDHRVPYWHDDFFKFYLDENNEFPSKYISTRDIQTTIKEIFESCVSVYFDWTNIELADFRKKNLTECEVVYGIKIPIMLNIEKRGKFLSLNSNNIEVEDFYGQILSRKSRIF